MTNPRPIPARYTLPYWLGDEYVFSYRDGAHVLHVVSCGPIYSEAISKRERAILEALKYDAESNGNK